MICVCVILMCTSRRLLSAVPKMNYVRHDLHVGKSTIRCLASLTVIRSLVLRAYGLFGHWHSWSCVMINLFLACAGDVGSLDLAC